MLVVNCDVRAQAFAGSHNTNNPEAKESTRGGGWSLFFFTGNLPTTEEEVKAVFNTLSLADMYNKSVGIAKSSYKQVFGRSLIEQHPQMEYQAKGASYCERIGNGSLTMLTPDRIVENSSTKKTISMIAAHTTSGLKKEFRGEDDYIIEFDNPVTLTHLKLYGAEDKCDIVSLVTSGGVEIEQSLGVVSKVSEGLFAFGSPVESTRYKIKHTAESGVVQTMDFLSNMTTPQQEALPKPSWCVLAHTNLLAHGDIHNSGQIMYIADHVRNEGPYVTSTNLSADKVNFVYCPKIRLDNWSS